MKFLFVSQPEKQPSNSFRADINALRAIAVLAVVFYHFSVPGFFGGFVGVDVFFVISGYLMTTIIVKGLSNNKFSIIDFYLARIRRILPALILLCASVLLLGWYLCAPDDYVITAKHVQDVLLFKSNNTFRKEAGYFDALSHDKWLLHTWSLSVEWQFYVLLPLFISGVWILFRRKSAILALLLLIALITYISCITKTEVDSAKAFYLLKYRAWEMVVGGLVLFLPELTSVYRKYSNLILFFGYSLIAASILFINGDSFWPGYLAAFPVVGSAMVIYSQRQDFILNRILPVQWAGSASYSIYLWHWPIAVLLAYFQKSGIAIWMLLGVVSSLAIGWLSYAFVEEKTRYGFGLDKYYSSIIVILSAIIVYCVSYRVVDMSGYAERVDADVVKISNEKKNKDSSAKKCIFGTDKELGPLSCDYGGSSLRAVVLGDSHAAALVTAVTETVKGEDGGIYLMSRAACPFVRGAHAKIRNDCDSSVDWIFTKLKDIDANIPAILITRGGRYAFGDNEGVSGTRVPSPPIYFEKKYEAPDEVFLAELREKSVGTICELAKSRRVYLVRPIPEMKVSVPEVMARYKMMGAEKRVSVSLREYYDRNQFVFDLQDEARKRCGAYILDPLPYLCDKESCYGDLDGRPLYFDDDHLSEFGNKVLVPMFSDVFRD